MPEYPNIRGRYEFGFNRKGPYYGPYIDLYAYRRPNEIIQTVGLIKCTIHEITKPEGAMEWEPTMTLRAEECQQLCDALFDTGFKPSSGHGSVGQLDAVTKHLNDMRQIAHHLLKIGKEEPNVSQKR